MENRRIYSGFTPSFIYRKEQFAPVLVLEVVEQTEAYVSLVVAGLGLAGRIGVGCYCSWL